METAKYDQVLLEGMIFHGHVGVQPAEKITGQDFVIDATIYCKPLAACKSDNLAQTVDYGQAFRLIDQIVSGARYELVERLAEEIADRLLQEFALAKRVEITVRKPQAPVQGRFSALGVRISRRRK